jgi:hypothetical protein
VKLVCYHKEWDWIAVHEGAYAVEVDDGVFWFWSHYLTFPGGSYMLTDKDFYKNWVLIGILDKEENNENI